MFASFVRPRFPSFVLLAAVLTTALTGTAAERFGGIEIGAKGIKVSAVEVEGESADAKLQILSLDKKTVDVTISRLKGKNFNEVKIDDVAQIVKEFQSALKTELMVPDENIRVVASSGVPFADNFGELVTAIQDETGLELSKIDAREEATLTTIALVPQDWRTKVLVVDIGSGNTKGGIFLTETAAPDDFVTLEIPYGTATFAKAVDEQTKAGGPTRSEVQARLAQERVGTPLRAQLQQNAELTARPYVLFSGGSVWAAATITHPERALDPFPSLSAADLKAYAALLAKSPTEYPTVDFAKIADPKAREAAQADYDRICGAAGAKAIFTPAELQAGASILNQVSDELKFGSRAVYFDRKAVTAWITAIITPEEYRHLLPGSLGRVLPQPVVEAPPVTPPPSVTPLPMPVPMPVTKTPVVPEVPLAEPKKRLEHATPEGLSKPAVQILQSLMFVQTATANDSIVYSAEFCREVAMKCYVYGHYQDALAFAKHSASQHETPSILYVQALSELALNQLDHAERTAQKLHELGGVSVDKVGSPRERLNGPRAVQLIRMVEQQ